MQAEVLRTELHYLRIKINKGNKNRRLRKVSISMSTSIIPGFKGLLLYTGGVLCHVE